MADGSGSGTEVVKSADRTLLVLEHLAASGCPQSLDTLHRELGIPKSSLHGLLRTMRLRGWLEVDSTKTLFSLGVRALLVGISYIDADPVVAMVADVLDDLATTTGETVHHGRLDGSEIVYLATRASTHYLRLSSRVGRRLPAHATALGKSLLAARSDDELDRILPETLEPSTPNTITDRDELRNEFASIRSRGYAIDAEESAVGIRCVAIAVPTQWLPCDAVSISIPLPRLVDGREEELVGHLEAARRELEVRAKGMRRRRH